MERSYLFAPGHNAKLLDRVFTAGADALMLDLEDAVPPAAKDLARRMVAAKLADPPAALTSHPFGSLRTPSTGCEDTEGVRSGGLAEPPAPVRAWVRVNAARTDLCAADLDAVAADAYGIRIPKAESPEDVAWVADRAPGKPIICAIESARGLLAAAEIAAAPGVAHLAMGSVDLQRDLGTDGSDTAVLYACSHLVVCSRAARIGPPIDSVYPRLTDDDGLRAQAELARSLGFFGKSAIHPRQLPVLHAVFTPTEQELAWAREVLAAFEAADGGAVALPDGEFVDLPVAQRAERLLARAPVAAG